MITKDMILEAAKKKSFDEWVELTVIAATQDKKAVKKAVANDEPSIALDIYAKEVAKKVGVPSNMINKVAAKVVDEIPV